VTAERPPTPAASAVDSPTLRSSVVTGIRWKIASQFVTQATRIATAIVFVRLMTPREYGLAGMVIIFGALVGLFSESSLGAMVVQRKDLTQRDCSTVFWSALAIGAAATLVCVTVGANAVAALYREPDVEPLLQALGFVFVLGAMGTTQLSLLGRAMRFRAIELRVMTATIAGSAVGITAAALGAGAWAIILQQLTATGVSTAAVWLASRWRPSLTFSRTSLRRFTSVSGSMFGSQSLLFLNKNADNFLIGRFLGPSPLGLYAAAYNVVLLPLNSIVIPAQDVLFPALSRLQDQTARVAYFWCRVTRAITAASAPLLLCLAVVAFDFVDVVFGDRWENAARVIQILALAGFIQSAGALSPRVLPALGRASTLFRFMILAVAVDVAAFAVGLHWGIVGVAVGYLLVTATIVQPLLVLITARAVALPVRDFLMNLRGVIEAAVILVGCGELVRAALAHASVAPAPRLALVAVAAVAAYALALRVRARDVLAELKALRTERGRLDFGVSSLSAERPA
jgi:O-antigen/teichoic acid export membrane protein